MNRILIVDDEAGVRFGIRNYLQTHGFEVEEAESCVVAETVFKDRRPDVVVSDYLLEDGNALDLLPRVKGLDPTVPFVVLTGHGSIKLAVQAIKEGADHFLTKPVEMSALLTIIQRILGGQRSRRKELASESKTARDKLDPFLGTSNGVRKLEDEAKKILSSLSPILIKGETGAGKGVLARWLFENGPRAEEAFVDLNCGGLGRDFLETELFGHEKGAFTGATSKKTGLLEVAHRGIVFLDEIGDVPPEVQPKILKVLEEKRIRPLGAVRDKLVDIRLIAATHHDLHRLVEEGRFRSDLMYRIGAIPLTIPPLRERREDIPKIADRLLQKLTAELGRGEIELLPDAVKALVEYPFPGNIRELRNLLERAVLLSDGPVLKRKDLRFERLGGAEGFSPSSVLTLNELERKYIEFVLEEEQGNVAHAAQRLGVPRSSLYQKLKAYQTEPSKI